MFERRGGEKGLRYLLAPLYMEHFPLSLEVEDT
jgi:hypothetical protein